MQGNKPVFEEASSEYCILAYACARKSSPQQQRDNCNFLKFCTLSCRFKLFDLCAHVLLRPFEEALRDLIDKTLTACRGMDIR